MIEIGDKVAIRFRESGCVTEVEWFALVYPTYDGPDDALNPDSIVGQILLGLDGPGARVEYEGNADHFGARRTFLLEVVDVWPGRAFQPQPSHGINDAA